MDELKSELSEREVEILKLVASGLSNKEIATRVYISPNTVKVHLRNIFSKINVVSRTEATLYAIREGYVQVGETTPVELPRMETTPPLAAPEIGRQSTQRISRRSGLLLAGLGITTILAIIAITSYPGLIATAIPPTANPVQIPQWETRAEMPTARAGFALTLYDNQIYAVAGQTENGPTDVVERYDPQTDQWQTLTAKPSAVSEVQAVTIGGRIYVPGGSLRSGQPTNKLEIYDPTQNIWTTGQNLPQAISAYALVAFEGKMFLFGGWNGQNYQNQVYEYNPDNDEWRVKTPMPSARGLSGAVAGGGRIFVIGGTDGKNSLSTNYIYSPQADNLLDVPKIWVEAKPLPEGNSAFGITVVIDTIYLFGGDSSLLNSLGHIWSYDIKTNEWLPLAQQSLIDVRGLRAIADGTRIFLMGGKKETNIISQNLRYQLIYIVPLPQIAP